MRYHNITYDDMLNGDGLRIVLWVSGCSHCCKGCHNPITWDSNAGIPFSDETKEEIKNKLKEDYISGITFSGGDPLYFTNRSEITRFAKEIKENFPDKTIWLYTGFLWEDICEEEVFRYVDVCVDGPFIAEEKDSLLMWKGSRNQRVIDVKKSLACKEVILHCKDYSKLGKGMNAPAQQIYGGMDT